jgi:hypothetical protein
MTTDFWPVCAMMDRSEGAPFTEPVSSSSKRGVAFVGELGKG